MIGDVPPAGARSASAPSQHPGDTRVRVPGVTHGLNTRDRRQLDRPGPAVRARPPRRGGACGSPPRAR